MKVAIIIILVVLVLLVGWAIVSYNGLVRLRNLVQEAWRQIDVELKRRHDLIPNLVETVKGTPRTSAGPSTRWCAPGPPRWRRPPRSPQAQQEGLLSAALGRLFAVAEGLPDLKANQNFLALQQELSTTEDRIAAGRRFYNANVRELNTKVGVVPVEHPRRMFHFTRAEYFEVEEAAQREAPQVSFGASGPGAPAAPAAPQPGRSTPRPRASRRTPHRARSRTPRRSEPHPRPSPATFNARGVTPCAHEEHGVTPCSRQAAVRLGVAAAQAEPAAQRTRGRDRDRQRDRRPGDHVGAQPDLRLGVREVAEQHQAGAPDGRADDVRGDEPLMRHLGDAGQESG
jgi:LemA protein